MKNNDIYYLIEYKDGVKVITPKKAYNDNLIKLFNEGKDIELIVGDYYFIEAGFKRSENRTYILNRNIEKIIEVDKIGIDLMFRSSLLLLNDAIKDLIIMTKRKYNKEALLELKRLDKKLKDTLLYYYMLFGKDRTKDIIETYDIQVDLNLVESSFLFSREFKRGEKTKINKALQEEKNK